MYITEDLLNICFLEKMQNRQKNDKIQKKSTLTKWFSKCRGVDFDSEL